jgi:HD-like signal output (HDOD) protein
MSELFTTALEDKEKHLIDYEKETIDFNHHQAGAWLGQKWKLPYEIIDVIEHHHDPAYEERNADYVILIGFFSRISRQWLLDTDLLKAYLDKAHSKLNDIQKLADEIAR